MILLTCHLALERWIPFPKLPITSNNSSFKLLIICYIGLNLGDHSRSDFAISRSHGLCLVGTSCLLFSALELWLQLWEAGKVPFNILLQLQLQYRKFRMLWGFLTRCLHPDWSWLERWIRKSVPKDLTFKQRLRRFPGV